MGDISYAMIDGELCEGCGAFMGEAVGHTRRCTNCRPLPSGFAASAPELRRTPTPWAPSKRAVARVPDPLPVPTQCPHCGGPVKLVRNSVIYNGREYGEWPWAYDCRPCDAYVGLHPFTGIPLGTLATAPMRAARQKAKAAFNPLWQNGGMTRKEAYAWASSALGLPPEQTHIGMFDVEMCGRLVAAVEARRTC